MSEDFFTSLGQSINGFVRWAHGIPEKIIVKQPSSQITEPKTPCTTCGQNKQQDNPMVSVNPNLENMNPNTNNDIVFSSGPSRVARKGNPEPQVNDNYISDGIHFS